MGSWSVYCGISKIAITAGDKCVLLPIRPNRYQSYQYYTNQPATLPIFGTYNDYGGLEDIERNQNTELIEKYFGASIDDFVGWFTEEVTYQREDINKDIFTNFEEMKDWNFMFISREVYDFISTNPVEKGHLDFGNPKILELIGFTKIGNSGDSRFKDKWVFEDKELWSDGRRVNTPDKQGLYYFKSSWGSDLSSYINIPEDKMWIGEKSMYQLWEHLDDKSIKEMFLPILTGRHYDGHEEVLESMLALLDNNQIEKFKKTLNNPKNIIDIYRNSIRDFGNLFSELVTLGNNLHSMSSTFEPYIKYLTPQCGEFRQHQVLLDKFAEINRNKIQEDEED